MSSQEKNAKSSGVQVEKYDSVDDLYASITEEGSLGLLALGAMRLMLWRKKKAEIKQQNADGEAPDG